MEHPAAPGDQKRDISAMLRLAGLRRTRQRMALAALLFPVRDRHVSAEELHAEALAHHLDISLATVYNTLNQCVRAGLLREIPLGGQKSYFDTNVSDHCHFYIENEGRLMDMPADFAGVSAIATPPAGYDILHVDVIARIATKA